MGVAGVALATVISQCISALLIVQCLMRSDADYRLRLERLRIVPGKLVSIVKIGLPAGLQGAIFSISNVLIHVLCKFLRFCGYGRKYGGLQY